MQTFLIFTAIPQLSCPRCCKANSYNLLPTLCNNIIKEAFAFEDLFVTHVSRLNSLKFKAIVNHINKLDKDTDDTGRKRDGYRLGCRNVQEKRTFRQPKYFLKQLCIFGVCSCILFLFVIKCKKMGSERLRNEKI